MTILPKKKTSKEKNDSDNTEHSHGHSHTHSSTKANDTRGRSRYSPPRWNHSNPRDESLTAHDPGGTYEDYETHEGGPSHSKRRHRSPPHTLPHRSVRKHRERVEPRTLHNYQIEGASATPAPETVEELRTGYNSEDEYDQPATENLDELECRFEITLKKKRGWIIKRMGEDGACLFRAIADQVYGDQEMHSVVRHNCIDYMAKNRDHFAAYITEDFNTYLNRKRHEHCHGNNIEMQAMSEMYNRPIEVYQFSLKPINTFHSSYKTDNVPIRLSYKGSHYNSIVDPYAATVGVGLGLPEHQPGAADRNLMRDALQQSENVHIEKTMLEDKVRETDWELTQETLVEQAARESYLQWLRDNEKRAKRQSSPRSASATCSSSAAEHSANWWENLSPVRSPETRGGGRSPRNRSGQNSGQNSPNRNDNLNEQHPNSPKAVTEGLPYQSGVLPKSPKAPEESVPHPPSPPGACGGERFQETSSLMNQLPPTLFGLYDTLDEDDILAQVIAQSEQEYLDSFKKNKTDTSSSSKQGPTENS